MMYDESDIWFAGLFGAFIGAVIAFFVTSAVMQPKHIGSDDMCKKAFGDDYMFVRDDNSKVICSNRKEIKNI